MNRDHSFLVVGCGGLGAAALYWLARMGAPYASVLGLDRGGTGRAGPDHGPVLRHVQRQDACAALAPAAHRTWRQIESLSGQRLVTPAGGLVVEDATARRPGRASPLDRYRDVAARHRVAVEELDAAGLAARWPQFRLDGSERALHQAGAGIVDARRAHATHLALARGHGAQVRERCPARAVRDTGRWVEVVTDDEVYRAEHVVLAADTGTNALLDGLARPLPLTVVPERTTYYATPNLIDFSPARFPVFRWYGASTFHGLPVHDDVATGLGGPGGDPGRDPEGDPDREPDSEPGGDPGRARRAAFLAERLPGFGGPELDTVTRRHAVPADHRPVLGTLPSAPRVSVALGGHAAPFASLAGRIVAELATTGRTRHPIGPFAADRPALAARPAAARPRGR